METSLRRHLATIALVILLTLLWEIVCKVGAVPEVLLPRPTAIAGILVGRFSDILPHAVQTLYTTLLGFALGVLGGVVLGILIGHSRVAYEVVSPLLVGFSCIPKVAMVPLFVLWFGAGTVPAVLTAATLCVFPVVVNVATGLATTEPEFEDVLTSLGASQIDMLTNVELPRMAPYFFAALKVAITQAFVGTVVAETVASNRGIGNLIMIASSNFDVPLMFAGLVVLAILGILLYWIFSYIERKTTSWAHRKSAGVPP